MIRRSLIVLVLACLCAGCTEVQLNQTMQKIPGLRDSDLQTHAVQSIKSVTVKRVAVMPMIESRDAAQHNTIEPGAAETIGALVTSEMNLVGGWEVTPEDDVLKVMQQLPPTTRGNMQSNAQSLGRQLSVDAVLYGMVERYKERVGSGYAAASPASVAFSLYFIDMRTKAIIWRAQYVKTQQALSQNVLDVVSFFKHQARWVRAVDIATHGVRVAIANLHSQLNLLPNVKMFPVGRELK